MNIEIAMQIVDCNIRRNEGDKDIEKIDPNRVLEATKIVLSKVEKLSLFSVSKQSELLIAFAHKWNKCSDSLIEDEYVYDYLEGNL